VGKASSGRVAEVVHSRWVPLLRGFGPIGAVHGGLLDGVGGQDGEPCVGEHPQGDVPVSGVIAADLVLIEPDLVLEAWKHSSIAQRDPATRTSSVSDAPSGA